MELLYTLRCTYKRGTAITRTIAFLGYLEARQKARFGSEADERPNGAEQLAHDPEHFGADRPGHPVRLPCLFSECFTHNQKTKTHTHIKNEEQGKT